MTTTTEYLKRNMEIYSTQLYAAMTVAAKKRSVPKHLLTQFASDCTNGEWDNAFTTLLDFVKIISTAPPGVFDFYRPAYGETPSAYAFYQHLKGEKLDEISAGIKEMAALQTCSIPCPGLGG